MFKITEMRLPAVTKKKPYVRTAPKNVVAATGLKNTELPKTTKKELPQGDLVEITTTKKKEIRNCGNAEAAIECGTDWIN